MNGNAYRNHLLVSFLVGILTTWLGGCRASEDELPGIARIQIVLSQNKPVLPLYFLEDSSRNQLALDVYYFNANNSFVTPVAVPTFLVNGEPITGNKVNFTQAGRFVITARVGKRISENELVVNVGSVADLIRSFTVQAAVPFVNADSTACLPLTYTVIDRQGHSLNLSDYPFVALSINGKPGADLACFSTTRAGTYSLQASFLGRKSDIFTVTARQPLRYEVVRLPVIIHILADEDAAFVNPETILADVNRVFRRYTPSANPNQADAYIEFVPARTDPDGRPLAVAGLDRLPVGNPTSSDTAVSQVQRTVKRWCSKQYINVFVSLDWQRSYEPGYSYSYAPSLAASTQATCATIQTTAWTPLTIPAVYIYDTKSFRALAHELGHFLGLGHTFSANCSSQMLIDDLPHHEKAFPDAKGLKYTCKEIPFISAYTMDYYVQDRTFTYEEVGRMRNTLTWASYIPVSSLNKTQRRGISAGGELERGYTID